MKQLKILILFLFIGFLAKSQTFNPSIHVVINDAMGQAQQAPLDGRSMFWDATNFIYRSYQNTSEVLSYLNLSKYRFGNFIIIVDSGGTLQPNGTYIGGVNTFWMFKDGTANGNLVELNLFGQGSTSGTVTAFTFTNAAGITGTVTNGTTTPNLTLGVTLGGDISGTSLSAVTVSQFNGQPPSFYQNYLNLFNTPTIPAQFNPIAGTNITLSGSYPNITFNATGLPTTAGYGINAALLATGVIAIDSVRYRKVDSLYTVNDSIVNMVLNGNTYVLQIRGGVHGSGSGAGTVTSVSVVTANGVSGVVANPTSTPAITLTLGAITPISVNGDTLAQLTNGFTIRGGSSVSYLLTVNGNATLKGTNTGDVTLAGENYLSIINQVITANPVNVSGTNITGILKSASFPALTGDITTSAGSLATTLASVISAGSCTNCNLTYDAKGRITIAANGSSGSGSTNVNIGAGYRWAIPTTNSIKTFFAGFGVKIDSSSNTNGLTLALDTANLHDTTFVQNKGVAGISQAYITGTDTINIAKLVQGANITLIKQSDSSIIIAASGTITGTIFSKGLPIVITGGDTVGFPLGSKVSLLGTDSIGIFNVANNAFKVPLSAILSLNNGSGTTWNSGNKSFDLGGTLSSSPTLTGGSGRFINLSNVIFIANQNGTGGVGNSSETFQPAQITMYAASSTFREAQIYLNNGTGIINSFLSSSTNGLLFDSTVVKLSAVSSTDSSFVKAFPDSVSIFQFNGYYRFSNLIQSGDTITYKPGGYDATGKLVRMNSWFGSGVGGSFAYTVATAPNTGNYTITTANFIILSDLTGQTNRNVVLPTSPTSGSPFVIKNINGNVSGFTWTFTNGTVHDYGGNTITTLVNNTVYQLVFDGTYYDIIN